MQYATGDVNSNEKGSGARANGGKIALNLIPFHLFAGVARVLMSGKLKYAGWNWAKGMPWTSSYDCLLRHLFKWWYLREDIDPESGEHHLDHVITNALFLKHYSQTYKEGDDRPPAYVDFDAWLEDFNTPFNEEEYLKRNPAIKKLVAERKLEKGKLQEPSFKLPDFTPNPKLQELSFERALNDRLDQMRAEAMELVDKKLAECKEVTLAKRKEGEA